MRPPRREGTTRLGGRCPASVRSAVFGTARTLSRFAKHRLGIPSREPSSTSCGMPRAWELARGGRALARGGRALASGGHELARGGRALVRGGRALARGRREFARGGCPFARGGGALVRGGRALARGGCALTRGGCALTRGGRMFAKGGRELARGGRLLARGGRVLARGSFPWRRRRCRTALVRVLPCPAREMLRYTPVILLVACGGRTGLTATATVEAGTTSADSGADASSPRCNADAPFTSVNPVLGLPSSSFAGLTGDELTALVTTNSTGYPG